MCGVAAAGITLLTVRELLTRWSTYDELVTCFNDCVLPAGTRLIEVGQGCVCFTVELADLKGCAELWKMYQSGTLKARLFDFLVTEETKTRAGGEEKMEFTVSIEREYYGEIDVALFTDEQELQQSQRSHSDPGLYTMSKEDEVSSRKVKKLEIKLKLLEERVKILEKEAENLESRPPRTDNDVTPEDRAPLANYEQIGRNSLSESKWNYIKTYVDSVQVETQSVLTDATDSGVGTKGAPSEIGLDSHIDGKDKSTVTESMFVAAKNGNITRLEKFLSLGRDVNSRDDNGLTPLRIAVLCGQSETVRYLLENGADPFVKGSYSRNLLHVASYGGQVAIIDEMIKQGLDVNSKDGNGDTPLILAAAYGRKNAVKYLLQRGADPSIKGCYGRTALHAGNDVAIIEILLSSGVHIDTKDADGNTPLIMAAASANVDAVNYLLTKGADQDVKGRLGRNTLHAAAQGGNVAIVETMLSLGLHINSKDSVGDTPLIIASACGKLEAVCLLLQKGAKPLITGQFGRNPLHAAAQCGHAAIIEKLLSRGAGMINSKDDNGNSPLKIATTCGKREAVHFLLEAGADLSVNVKNRFNTSLLHAAAKGGDVEIIKTMLSRGLDANSKDSNGRTPSMIAKLNGKTEAVALLLSKEGR